jgi:hypothetical protein
MGSAAQNQTTGYGGMNQQYSSPNWWVPSSGQGQPQGGQPLWQNPYSPMTPADWEALKMQYYPPVAPAAGSAASLYQSYLRGGESEMSDAIESYYGPSPNPAIFGPIAAKVQQWTGLPPEYFTVTHAAPSAYDAPDYQLGGVKGAVSGVEAADVSQATTVTSGTPPGPGFGEAGTLQSTMGQQDTGWGVVGNTGGEGAQDIYGEVALGSPQDMTRGMGYKAWSQLSSAARNAVSYGHLGSFSGYGDFESESFGGPGTGGGFGFGVGGEGFGDNEGYGGGEGGARGW